MRKHHRKNIQLHEDGFDAKYFARKHRMSTQRARAWTDRRAELEAKYPTQTAVIYLLIGFTPVVLTGVYIWRMA